MTRSEMIKVLERVIKESGDVADNTNTGIVDKAKISLRAMDLLADLKGWKQVVKLEFLPTEYKNK